MTANTTETRFSLRRLVTIGGLLLLAAFIGLLAWALIKPTVARTGPLGINSAFGDVKITQRPAADFTLHSFDGSGLSLSAFRGKLVVLDFWASWCPPCQQEASGLAQVSAEYRDKGVQFLGVDVWDRDSDARRFI